MSRGQRSTRLIVVTGVSRGLGRALALEFARLGCTVLGCARGESALESLKAELGEPHDLAVVDVSDDEAVGSWAQRVLRSHGTPELLVNNAAIINRNAPLWEVSVREVEDLFRVNLLGTSNTIRHFLPPMIERGRGVVVNFSSYWGRGVAPQVAPYCASKWGIEGLTRALAQDLPSGLAAVAFNPGIIDTDMLRSCFGAGADRYLSALEWAKGAAPYLLSLGPAHNGKSVTAPGQ
jgi:NAD(P)-dependent dehydrogenase (short-subunit alcohol dehydrogenase family)